jgi:hypothetical protein
MSEIVDFTCVQIQSGLDDYDRTGIIPEDLMEGVYTADDILSCLRQLPQDYSSTGNALIRAYTRKQQKNLKKIKQDLKDEYHHLLGNLSTTHYGLVFPSVINRYRIDINPVAALYYDCRELTRHFNPEDDRHIWLHSVVTDKKLNNTILDALSRDIKHIEKFVKKYHWSLTNLSDSIPLELFHARQIIKDFSQFYVFFAGIVDFEPEDHY